MITDCIFDLYGTLVDIRTDEEQEALWEALAIKYSPYGMLEDPKKLHHSYQKLVEREKNCLLEKNPDGFGEINLEKVFAALMKDRNIAVGDPLLLEVGRFFRESSIVHLRPYPGVEVMLRSLHNAGKRVWLLSNAQRIFTAPELDKLELSSYFDGIYLSSDYGVKKPSEKFFQILLKEQGISPEHAVMTGNDGLCDIRGAKRLGLQTLYLRSETSPKGDNPNADYYLSYPDMEKVTELLLSL